MYCSLLQYFLFFVLTKYPFFYLTVNFCKLATCPFTIGVCNILIIASRWKRKNVGRYHHASICLALISPPWKWRTKAILLSIFPCLSVAPFKKNLSFYVLSVPWGSLTSALAGLMFKTFLERVNNLFESRWRKALKKIRPSEWIWKKKCYWEPKYMA